MNEDKPDTPRPTGRVAETARQEEARRARMAAALRDNLKKRKAQMRGRKDEGVREG